MSEEIKKITLYKVKDNKDISDVITNDEKFYDKISETTVKIIGTDYSYSGYIKFNNGTTKTKNQDDFPWVKFLNEVKNGEKYEFKSSNKYPRAIAVISINERTPSTEQTNDKIFILSFGIGIRNAFNANTIIHDFGIKTGMSLCDKISRVQTSYHESISHQTEKQASAPSNFKSFNLDNEKEILKKISGLPKTEYNDLLDTFEGKESITIKCSKSKPISWDKLIELCLNLDNVYRSNAYQNSEDFAHYDDFKPESDNDIIDNLNKQLLESLNSRSFDHIHLAPPEFVDYQDTVFLYKDFKKIGDDKIDYNSYHNEISINDYFNERCKRKGEITSHTINRTFKIYKYSAEKETVVSNWSLYKCIVAELEFNQKNYILTDGKWFEISQNLIEKVTLFTTQYNEGFEERRKNYEFFDKDINIYDEDRGKNHEDVFNYEIAANNNNIILFDKAKIRINGAGKSFEMCDLLSTDKFFYHVKRYSSGAASISHLFVQMKFYSDAFLLEENTRKSMKDYLTKTINDKDSVNNKKSLSDIDNLIPVNNRDVIDRDYTVVAVILTEKNNFCISSLPLMAQYELMLTYNYLTENRKFKVDIIFVKVQTQNKPK